MLHFPTLPKSAASLCPKSKKSHTSPIIAFQFANSQIFISTSVFNIKQLPHAKPAIWECIEFAVGRNLQISGIA